MLAGYPYESVAGGNIHVDEYVWFDAPWQRTHVTPARPRRLGVYPGSFDPPTVAHMEIALTARSVHGLDRVDLAISLSALGKDRVSLPTFDERLAVITASVAAVDGLGVIVTEHQLIADIADGYDVVVMGADKWQQINDLSWYAGPTERDAAIASLPDLALAPRAGFSVPDAHRLPVPAGLLDISSSAVRAGRTEWMTPQARAHHDATGAWGHQ